MVTRRSSISRRISSGSGASGMTTVPPVNRTGSTFTPVPPVRKNGVIAIVTSSLRKSTTERRLMTFQVMLPCVSITPFGVPVVPDVCGSMHTSSSPMTSVDGIVGGLRDEVLVVDLRARRRTDDHTGPHARRKRNASRRLLHHDDRGRVSRQHIGDDGVVEPMIDRCHDRTELRGREQDLEERRMVGAEPADTVSPLDAELAEPVREAANPVRELTVRAASPHRGSARADQARFVLAARSTTRLPGPSSLPRLTAGRDPGHGQAGSKNCPGQRGCGAREGIARPLRPGS